jgi:hypothetical protein
MKLPVDVWLRGRSDRGIALRGLRWLAEPQPPLPTVIKENPL